MFLWSSNTSIVFVSAPALSGVTVVDGLVVGAAAAAVNHNYLNPVAQWVAYLGGEEYINVPMPRPEPNTHQFIAGIYTPPTIKLLKYGSTTWVSLSTTNYWTPTGNGIYRVKLGTQDKNVFGMMLVKVWQSTTSPPVLVYNPVWVGINQEEFTGDVKRIRTIHRRGS